MRLFLSILLCAALAGQVAAALMPGVCRITMTPNAVRGATFKAEINIPAGCKTTYRVRKSSTINTRRGGAPYQPIKPLTGAWNVSASTSTIPADQLWSLVTWRWEYWQSDRWQPIPGGAP